MTKQELSNLYWLNREIEEEKRKLEELETAASGCTAKITGLPHVTGVNKKVEDYGILIAEQRELIELKIKQSVIEYNKLNRFIADISDSYIRQIISLRYINGLKWYQVAMHIGGGITEEGVKSACHRYLNSH